MIGRERETGRKEERGRAKLVKRDIDREQKMDYTRKKKRKSE